MSDKNEAKNKFSAMCSQMLPYFALPEFKPETEKNNLQFYHFISQLGLLAWNITLVKPSLAAAVKTLNQISKTAFADSPMILDLLRIAAEWKWNHCRNENVFFSNAEATYYPETGDPGFLIYSENEAAGKGMSFSEFRKAVKNGDAGRNIAILMKERFDLDADLENFLQYRNRFGLPLYTSKQNLAVILFQAFKMLEDIQSEEFLQKLQKNAFLVSSLLFTVIPQHCCYEDAKKHFSELNKTKLFEINKNSSRPFIQELRFAIGLELFYGHDSFLDDWDKIVECALVYVPEQYQNMAENEFRQYVKHLSELS